MLEPTSTLVAHKIVTYVAKRAVDELVKAFREEIARIHNLIEANTRADLYAALDQVDSAMTLKNPANRNLHLNFAITEFNKALRRLQDTSNATPDRLLARFGKAYSYILLEEQENAQMELQRLAQDISNLESEIRAFYEMTQGFDLVVAMLVLPKYAYYGVMMSDKQKETARRILKELNLTTEESAGSFVVDLIRHEKAHWLEWWDLACNLRVVTAKLANKVV